MSADLAWLIVKKNNAFLVKRDGAVFSRESNNLYNVNSQKFSGLIGKKSIGVSAGAGNKGVVVRVFKKKAAHQPAKSVASFVIARPSVRRAAKTVKGLAKNHYRSSLQKAALARVSAVVASQKSHPAVKKGRVSLKA